MCKVLGYSKQAYYKQLHTSENTAEKEATVVGLIHQKRTLWKRGSGRNLHKCLEPELASLNIKMGRDTQFFFPPFYKIKNLPFMALYNSTGKLITTFEGTTPMKKLLDSFKGNGQVSVNKG